MARLAVTVYLPLRTNEGKRVPVVAHVSLQEALLDIAGGFTELPECSGVWKDEGKLYVDQLQPILVALEEGTNQEAKLASALLAYDQHADQCAYFIQVGSECRILTIAELTELAEG